MTEERKEEKKEFDIDIKDKEEYSQERVLGGFGPHKLIRLGIKKYLEKVEDEKKDILDDSQKEDE